MISVFGTDEGTGSEGTNQMVQKQALKGILNDNSSVSEDIGQKFCEQEKFWIDCDSEQLTQISDLDIYSESHLQKKSRNFATRWDDKVRCTIEVRTESDELSVFVHSVEVLEFSNSVIESYVKTFRMELGIEAVFDPLAEDNDEPTMIVHSTL